MTRTEKFRFLSLLLLGAGAFLISGYLMALAPHLRGGLALLTLLAIAIMAGLEYLEVSQEAKEKNRALKDSERARIAAIIGGLVFITSLGIYAAG